MEKEADLKCNKGKLGNIKSKETSKRRKAELGERETERDTQRETQRETETDREKEGDRQTDRQRQADRQTAEREREAMHEVKRLTKSPGWSPFFVSLLISGSVTQIAILTHHAHTASLALSSHKAFFISRPCVTSDCEIVMIK